MIDGKHTKTRNKIQDIYNRTKLGWVLLIFADLVVQGLRSADSTVDQLMFLGTFLDYIHDGFDNMPPLVDRFELIATIAFDIEMAWRIAGYFPDWRAFGQKSSNLLDLFLAIFTSLIQIPIIHRSYVYAWLTITQLARFYRVILTVPRMRPLLVCTKIYNNLSIC